VLKWWRERFLYTSQTTFYTGTAIRATRCGAMGAEKARQLECFWIRHGPCTSHVCDCRSGSAGTWRSDCEQDHKGTNIGTHWLEATDRRRYRTTSHIAPCHFVLISVIYITPHGAERSCLTSSHCINRVKLSLLTPLCQAISCLSGSSDTAQAIVRFDMEYSASSYGSFICPSPRL